ncbi:MAG: hypothetical protein ACKO5E_06385, partial [bacterium]
DREATRAAIVEVLEDYPTEAAEVWGRLEPEPVILPVPMAGTIEEADSEAEGYSTSNRPPDSDMARGLVLLPHFVGRVRWCPGLLGGVTEDYARDERAALLVPQDGQLAQLPAEKPSGEGQA